MERKVLRTPAEASDFLRDFNWKLFSLDTETTSLDWYNQQVLGISLCDGRKTCYIPLGTNEGVGVWSWLFGGIVAEPNNTIIMHNATFDTKALTHFNLHIYQSPSIEFFDTMVAAHLIDENGEHGLKHLAKRYLGEEPASYEDVVKKGTDSQEFYEYAMNDAEWTYRLALLFKPLLDEQGLTTLFREIEMPFLKVLARMEMNGVLVDRKRVEETTVRLREKVFDLETKMLQSLGIKYQLQHNLKGEFSIVSKVNFGSPLQLKKILAGIGFPVETTDKNELRKLAGKHPFIDLLIQFKAAQKLLSAFFEPLPSMIDQDGRVRPHFRDTGTVTGRLSCSKPNLQQLPKESKDLGVNTRSCFIASPGKKMVAVDYSQQELRIAAHLCQDPTFVNIIKNDGDLHLSNANAVFNLGIPQEALFTTHPDYETYKAKYKKERDKGKVFSFGILYGMGEHKLSRDFNIGIEEAKRMLDNYFRGYPKLREAIEETHRAATKDLYVSTRAGRRRHFTLNEWGKLDGSSLRQSFNFLIQSYGADLIRMACIKLQDYADRHPEMGISLLMTVHDEIVFECADGWEEYVRVISERILEGCDTGMVVPLKAEANVGIDYGEAK
jgi:DNA polymerase-1